MSLLALFCEVEDFCQTFEGWLSSKQLRTAKPGPKPRRSSREVMTIVIHFHQKGYRTFITIIMFVFIWLRRSLIG